MTQETGVDMRAFAEVATRNIGEVVEGHDGAIRMLLVAVLCGGHALCEDVPGVGKTRLAVALAQSLGLDFRRIQGTPDRLPAEITGSSVWNAQTTTFQFMPGPIFGQCVLFDELNRAPAKTQAALLEAMEEGQVTVDGVTHPLPRPFFVIATQNPVELEGTFPPSEAALDRFFVRVRLSRISGEELRHLLGTWVPPEWRMDATARDRVLAPIIRVPALFALRQQAASIYASPEALDYVVRLAEATHAHPDVLLGLSPRGTLSLLQAARAWAALDGSDHVLPDHVQRVLAPVAAHRLILHPEADLRHHTPEVVLRAVVERTAVDGSWAGSGGRNHVPVQMSTRGGR